MDARDRHTLTARQGRAIHPDLPGADRRSPASHGRRRIGLAVLAILLGVPPVPNGTVARGLIWIPKESRVVALGSGRLARFLVEPGSQVTRGQALANLEEPFASGKRAKAQARLDEVDARLRGGGPFAL